MRDNGETLSAHSSFLLLLFIEPASKEISVICAASRNSFSSEFIRRCLGHRLASSDRDILRNRFTLKWLPFPGIKAASSKNSVGGSNDEPEQEQRPHQEADERLHGLVAGPTSQAGTREPDDAQFLELETTRGRVEGISLFLINVKSFL